MEDPTTSVPDLGKGKGPCVDVSALVEGGRKDIEALVQASQITFEGLLLMAQKQTEILTKTIEEVQVTTQTSAAARVENVTRQGQGLQQAFTRAFEYGHELAEVIRKSQTEAMEVINERVQENIEEFKGLLKL